MPTNPIFAKIKPRYMLLGILLLVGAIRRFALPSVPFADGDILGYFMPAVRLIEDGIVSHQGTRSFVYPLFIAGLMKLSGTVTIIPIVQHLLGLFAGYLLFATFELPLFKALREGKMAYVATAVQLLCTGFMLITNTIFEYEHFVTSQSVSTLLLVGQIYLLVELIGGNLPTRKALRTGGYIIFMALLTYILTPRMGFALPLVGLLVLVEFYLAKISIKKWVMPVLIPGAVFAVLIFVPERYLVKKYDPYTDTFPIKQFFYIHADIAKTLISEDIANNQTPYSTGMLQRIDSIMLMPTAPHQHFKYLGFDADTMLIGGYDAEIHQALTDSGYQSIYFLLHYDKRILTEKTGSYLLKVLDQLQHYYVGADGYDRYCVTEHPELYNAREMTLEMTNQPEMYHGQLSEQFRNLAQEQLTNWSWYSSFTFAILLSMPSTFGYLLLIIVFIAIQFVLLFRLPAIPGNHSHLLRLAVYMLLLQFALALTIAVIHSFDIYRYGVWIVPAEIMVHGAALIGIANSIALLKKPPANSI